jgi:hypothetical protein
VISDASGYSGAGADLVVTSLDDDSLEALAEGELRREARR